MADLLSSRIQIIEEEPTIRSFPTLPTAVLAIQGVSRMGPIADPQLVTSWEEYLNLFGTYLSGVDRQMALCIRDFFLNGGTQAYVSRVVHFTNVDDKLTATAVKGSATLQTAGSVATSAEHTGSVTEPFDLEPADTLIANVEGIGNQTATISAVEGAEECSNAETYALSDGDTLTIKINGESTAQSIVLAGLTGGAATAEQIAQSINAQLTSGRALVSSGGAKVTVQSDRRGSSSSVQITGGTASAVMGFDGLVHTGAAGSNVANVDAVTVAELKVILEAAWTNGSGVTVTSDAGKVKVATVATGAAATLAIVAATANTVVGFTVGTYTGSAAAPEDTLKMEGTWAGTYVNSMTIKVSAATSGTASEFNLYVMSGTNVLETFSNITMDTAATRYAPTYINNANVGSKYFTATDMVATGSVLARRPANTSGAIVSGGDDGLTSLDNNDFIGSVAGNTGLNAFDTIEDITLLSCPDNTATAVQVAMLEYCGSAREGLVFALLDSPPAQSAVDIVAHRATLNTSTHLENGALYWPRTKIVNPNTTIFGTAETVTVCPSGDIAGRAATNDATLSEGPFTQLAGTEYGKPAGWVGLETEEAKLRGKLDLVFPQRINPISHLRSYGYFVDGSRTLKGDGNFPSVGERRGVSHVERLLNEGLQWVRHRNNTPALRSEVEMQVYALLHGYMTKGAFASTDPNTAFFIDVSDALNPPSSVRAGKLVLRVGLATNTPSEFIIIKVTKDTRALTEELFG